MLLRSSAFAEGEAIPCRFTCDGEDLSPPLDWDALRWGTRSFVLPVTILLAPAGTWHHWAAFDVPAALTGLDAGAAQRPEKYGFRQAINDFKRPGYGGPCPPRGHRPHHYRFRLFALSTERLAVRDKPHCRDIEREARKHVLAEAVLDGTYGR
jgi:Raf kinase inhibitor-like YbhB/YbcL family protein